MTLDEIRDILEADLIVGENKIRMNIERAFGADLMSDVLAFAKEGSLLLTGLINPLVVRTADTIGLSAIVFVRGKRPSEETVKLAIEKNIPLLSTRYIMFETCGRLYSNGIRGSVSKVNNNLAGG
ncbi:MAG: DRTGG domain-containing protein [Thermodesulfobacteriota bacterium]|nr:DRTGG domain-containing protein [Thermodesulfobacteriota bacterium]